MKVHNNESILRASDSMDRYTQALLETSQTSAREAQAMKIISTVALIYAPVSFVAVRITNSTKLSDLLIKV